MSSVFYDNPLIERYASREMAALWGPQRKFSTWRKLWVILAETQAELGLPITPEQLEELRQHVDDINLDVANQYERQLRHDVMAHIRAYGDQCPRAKGIIHLGATSCYVTDNTDLMLIRESFLLLRKRLVNVIDALGRFAERWRDQPCLAFTHFQPAQPTTVGKRACLWAYDFVLDLEEVEHRLSSLKARGAKGTTGTQASFLTLFEGDHGKVEELDRRVTAKMGFAESYPVTGQTYPRKVDSQVLDVLSGIAQSAHKMATDIRLLAHRKEIEEPFETTQVGSSAMPYKRNPMRCERICGLARFVLSLQTSGPMTAATQWLERTLDDSANRRLVLPQAFLAADAILILCQNVVQGLVVYPQVIERNLRWELPFLATEEILMAATARGGDRQELHERLRKHSQEAARRIKEEGAENDLLERLASDPAFGGINLHEVLDPRRFVGRAPQQVDDFIERVVRPIRQRYGAELGLTAEVKV
ncbi:MAG: adenylosuccinate lyase [Thermoguttaceae bacterium]|nr:adenylosuccinate lyase [Thermoguttaceae bacterium]MDW8077696.1 adenylosuccinate lyase [Thermoguttaceae bacterium]